MPQSSVNESPDAKDRNRLKGGRKAGGSELMALALVDCLKFFEEAAAPMNSLCQFAAVHGLPYKGPNWLTVEENCRAALAAYRSADRVIRDTRQEFAAGICSSSGRTFLPQGTPQPWERK